MTIKKPIQQVEIHRTTVDETILVSMVGGRSGTSGDTAERQDADLADVVRTMLGPLIKRLDLPRIHVMAEGHRVLLHGEVMTASDAQMIAHTVEQLPGVEAVESHLHVGLVPGDTRPSEGAPAPSAMMSALVAAAGEIGLHGAPARAAAWGALSAILEQVPPPERHHVFSHLPTDVSDFVRPRRRYGDEELHWQTELQLDAATALRGGITMEEANELIPKVIRVLKTFVPEEAQDIQATLHAQLKHLWSETGPEGRDPS